MTERLPSQFWTWHVLQIYYTLSTTTINHVEEIGILTLNRTWHKLTNYDLASKRNFEWLRVSLWCCNLSCWQIMKRRDHHTICDAQYLRSRGRMWSKSPNHSTCWPNLYLSPIPYPTSTAQELGSRLFVRTSDLAPLNQPLTPTNYTFSWRTWDFRFGYHKSPSPPPELAVS